MNEAAREDRLEVLQDWQKPAAAGLTVAETYGNANTPPARRQRFLRLAAKRTEKVLKAIDQLEFCANRASYAFTPEEARQIVDAIATAALRLERAFFPELDQRAPFQLELREGGN